MPSSNKTPFLKLNQWADGDKPKWPDHNADNSAIDVFAAGVAGSINTPYIGANGNWFLWDMEEAQYIDTGKMAIGTGLDILGTYATPAALAAAITSPAQGDMYNVGTTPPYHIYMWDATEPPAAWRDQGILQGQDGAPGPNVINADTDTPFTGLIMGNGDKVAQATPGIDYAAAQHAAQHAADGADPIKVGAEAGLLLFTGLGGVLDAKSMADARAALSVADIEVGVWTPVFRAGTTNPTYNISANSSSYIRMGKVWFVSLMCTFTISNPGSGNAIIDGLPIANISAIANTCWPTPQILGGSTVSPSFLLTFNNYIIARDGNGTNSPWKERTTDTSVRVLIVATEV